jgi:hypothetical protein
MGPGRYLRHSNGRRHAGGRRRGNERIRSVLPRRNGVALEAVVLLGGQGWNGSAARNEFASDVHPSAPRATESGAKVREWQREFLPALRAETLLDCPLVSHQHGNVLDCDSGAKGHIRQIGRPFRSSGTEAAIAATEKSWPQWPRRT